MKKHERMAIKAIDLPEDIIEPIRKMERDPKYPYLNELLETCTPENTRLSPEDKDWLT